MSWFGKVVVYHEWSFTGFAQKLRASGCRAYTWVVSKVSLNFGSRHTRWRIEIGPS